MKRTTKLLSLLLAVTILCPGCATLLSGSYQNVNFNCNKDGAVYQNLKEIGKTNTNISVKRRDLQKLYTVKAIGCPDKQFELPLRTNTAFLINMPLMLAGIGILTAYFDVYLGNNMATDKTIPVEVNCKD